ncbi:MAG: BatA domain-containing protein [Planctomycetota bacterium]|nr:BatA domain-containing protein [Planctomycetota bacterium]
MNFFAASFLTASVAIAGPTLIHLLNRRRYRTQPWAAMQFLRNAVKRNRRAVQIRDLILLALRTLAVLFFVLAMARPYWVGSGSQVHQNNEPVHAVIVLDNSLSMGYTSAQTSLLEEAKDQVSQFIEMLPSGSEVSIIPLCVQPHWFNVGAFASRDDALNALRQMEVVDLMGDIRAGTERALIASKNDSSIQTKRFVFLGDLQEPSWNDPDLDELFGALGDVQIVPVQPAIRENTWVSKFYLRDGIADADSMAVFVAEIRHEGLTARDQVPVSLEIDGDIIATTLIDLMPHQMSSLVFEHQFTSAGSSKEPLFSKAILKIDEPDYLPVDDQRVAVVPVIARVPVVFVDQHGTDENPERGRFGETYMLRHLLAPQVEDDLDHKALIDIVHRTIDTVTQEDLQDARLVVISGSMAPHSGTVDLLREYAEQGGQVLITAGGLFDTAAWTEVAWNYGNGILPMAIMSEPIGSLPPNNADDWPQFKLDPKTFDDPLYRFELSTEEVADLVLTPSFYKAVNADEDSLIDWDEKESLRIEDRLAEEDDRIRWLNWTNPLGRHYSEFSVEQLVARNRPQPLGRYQSGEPFLVQRRMGQGRIMLLTSGVFPEWNNIALDAGVLIMDRILRHLLVRSLPERTLETRNEMVIPVPPRHQHTQHMLQWPDQTDSEAAAVEVLGRQKYGVVLRGASRRGFYELYRTSETENDQTAVMQLAFNGPEDESNIQLLDVEELEVAVASDKIRWVQPGQAISLQGTTYLGSGTWKWLMYLLLFVLLLEMFLLGKKRQSDEDEPAVIRVSGRQSTQEAPEVSL